VNAGRVKMLGVGHSTRIKELPGIPAINETVPGFYNTGWWGVLAPAGTPKAIIDRLNTLINKSLSNPELVKRFTAMGVMPTAPATPEEFGKFLREDQQRWIKVLKSTNLRID
jgi:tripartite-type tricarboxylate transporter receptor subunit TctC